MLARVPQRRRSGTTAISGRRTQRSPQTAQGSWPGCGRPSRRRKPYVSGETRIGHSLFWPALLGAIGSCLVLWGASQPTSPFTLNQATYSTLGNPALSWHYPPLWYFGAGAPRGDVLVGVVAVYAGMFLLIRAWMALARLTRVHPGITDPGVRPGVRRLAGTPPRRGAPVQPRCLQLRRPGRGDDARLQPLLVSPDGARSIRCATPSSA